jgi:hypothetical protein
MSEHDEDRKARLRTDLCGYAAADCRPENFVCVDVEGVEHDLKPPGSCYHIVSKPEGALHRIHAGYWPDELAEDGLEGCRHRRGYDPIEFVVAEAEHARMVRDGVIDVVGGQSLLAAMCDIAVVKT